MIWISIYFLLIFPIFGKPRYQADPDEKLHDYHSQEESEKRPYKDDLWTVHTGFEVHPFSDGNYSYEKEYEGYERHHSGLNIYDVRIMPGMEILLTDRPMNIEWKKTKEMIDYHCLTLQERACIVQFEVIDIAHRVIYRKDNETAHIIKLFYNSPGDVYFRFVNKNVRSFKI